MRYQLYNLDFDAWKAEQAALLRAGKLSDADVEHIAQELDSMGASDRRELVRRLRVLLLHLLKWHYQPSHRGASPEASIVNSRDELAGHLQENPSLRPLLPPAMETAYRRAAVDAVAETGLAKRTFPPTCPWTFDLITDPNFWPSD